MVNLWNYIPAKTVFGSIRQNKLFLRYIFLPTLKISLIYTNSPKRPYLIQMQQPLFNFLTLISLPSAKIINWCHSQRYIQRNFVNLGKCLIINYITSYWDTKKNMSWRCCEYQLNNLLISKKKNNSPIKLNKPKFSNKILQYFNKG